MTPEDVRTVTFPKSRFGGYDMLAVDRFLSEVEQEIATKQDEIYQLKSKMVVLVREIEKLRNDSECSSPIQAYGDKPDQLEVREQWEKGMMWCTRCHSKWSGPESQAINIGECPFCNAPLLTPAKKCELKTFPFVLKQVVDVVGESACRNGKTLLSVFSDFAPNMIIERRLLQAFTECRGNELLLSAVRNGTGDTKTVMEKS